MEIAPIHKNKLNSLEDLVMYKADLKRQIQQQKQQISITSQKLVSPITIALSVLNVFHKAFNVTDGIQTGIKLFRYLGRFFVKK
jgi:hypothetical protein